MSRRLKLIAVLLVSTVVVVPIGGGATSQTQRVAIESTGSVFAFSLRPIDAGTLRHDTGAAKWTGSTTHKLTRDGQSVAVETVLGTFVGKRGTFGARFRIEWTSAGNGFRAGVARWTIQAGTGAYERLVGGGRSSAVFRPDGNATMRAEGLLRS
jgi:hypothetical protein